MNIMDDQREEPREEAKMFITVEGHDLWGHEKLEALVTNVSNSGICIYSQFPFEINSVVNLYLGGELAAKGEIADVITDDSQENAALRTRIGIQLTYKYEAWPYYS